MTRAKNSKNWVSHGEFEGNADTINFKLHRLGENGEGLVCHKIRFYPTTTKQFEETISIRNASHTPWGLRVQAWGESSSKTDKKQSAIQQSGVLLEVQRNDKRG